MARAPRSTMPKPTNKLLEAISFCSIVSEKLGAPFETHIGLKNNWAIAFNGIVAAGAPIETDLICYPHTLLLVEALSKCDENFTLTQLDNGRLNIKSGKFKAIVPCLDPLLMQEAAPDPSIAPLNNKFLEAINRANAFDTDTSHVVMASILLKDGAILSTNRKVIYEEWHGNSMPTLPVPKSFVDVLYKIKKNLVSFGFSNNSLTLFFEDNCWIRTQLFSANWPDLNNILDLECRDFSVPPDLWKAVDAIKSFSEDGWIYCQDGVLYSHPDKNVGACFECGGVPNGIALHKSQLEFIKPWATSIDFMAPAPNGRCIKVFGNNARCVIAHKI